MSIMSDYKGYQHQKKRTGDGNQADNPARKYGWQS